MIVATPWVPDHVGAAMERDGRDKQVLNHQLIDSATSDRVHTHAWRLVVWKIAIRIEELCRLATFKHSQFLPYVMGVTISICHGRDDQLTRLKYVGQVVIFAEIRSEILDEVVRSMRAYPLVAMQLTRDEHLYLFLRRSCFVSQSYDIKNALVSIFITVDKVWDAQFFLRVFQ